MKLNIVKKGKNTGICRKLNIVRKGNNTGIC